MPLYWWTAQQARVNQDDFKDEEADFTGGEIRILCQGREVGEGGDVPF